jgi:hypothetical protein
MADERTLVADIKSYIDKIPGFSAEVELHTGIKRMDLLVKYNNTALFNAEFKKPTTWEGKTARNSKLVDDAFHKANEGPQTKKYFLTSNFNEYIVWDNTKTDLPLPSRDIYMVKLNNIIKEESDLEREEVKKEIEEKIKEICNFILQVYTGQIKAVLRPLGESFIIGLNDHLNMVTSIIAKFIPNNIISKWWKEQGYEPKIKFDSRDKERMARYVLYVLSNKIFFYYYLKRTFKNMRELNFKDVKGIKEFKESLEKAFQEAKGISGDYETVFESSEADQILFLDEEELEPELILINFLAGYDFSSLPQDLLGNIYDRLINPEERHANGQYYTPIPVVDLINALTITKKDAKIMDPACGSGTFLTRAFDLKLMMYGQDSDDIDDIKENIIKDLFGCDIAPYPTHLATMALASKLVKYNPNVYPNIIRSDFMDLRPENLKPRFRIELQGKNIVTTDLSGKENIVSFTPIDAFVSNLPYVRQEEIKNKKVEQEKVKNFLKEHGITHKVKDKNGNNKTIEIPYCPHNKADLHVYFWYYMVPFMKEGSRAGFLTSDTWLNTDYGTPLKEFINRYFRIIAIIDSSVERWFEDALVNTVITIIERTDNSEARENNMIKFVRINKKISEIIKNLDDAIKIAKNIEKGIDSEGVKIVRIVRQGDIDFSDIMKGKLYQYLRAPDEFFMLINNNNMVPLENIMNIQFGIKTGANDFFYVEDVTNKYDRKQLKEKFGLRIGETKKLRIIKSGDGTEHVIEKEYLKPIIKGPKEYTDQGKLKVSGTTKKFVVVINEEDKSKVRRYAKEYLDYGENNPSGKPYAETETCKARNPWWKLSPQIIPEIVFGELFSSTFIYPKTNFMLDHTMYLGNMKNEYKNDLLAVYAFMNSSISYLYPDFLGRNYGGGGAPTAFMVFEVKKLPVIKPEILRPYYLDIERIMKSMEARKIGSVFEEIWDMKEDFSLDIVKKERLELDRLLLKAIGISDPDTFLFNYYQSVVRTVKERLDKASSLKTNNKKIKVNYNKVTEEILRKINLKDFPDDYVIDYTNTIIHIDKGKNIKYGNNLSGFYVSIDGKEQYYKDIATTKFVYYSALNGKDEIKLPKDVDKAIKEYEEDIKTWKEKIEKEIEEITSNEDTKDRLLKICKSKVKFPWI